MTTDGDRLERFAAFGQREVLLVAPFIKQGAIRRLLGSISVEVSVSIVTRWRPDEVAAGVSDLEVFDVVAARSRTSLALCHELHAKYYRADSRVMFGSANLTDAALGWSPRSNLELLVEVDPCCYAFDEFERRLRSRSVPATAEIRDRVARAAAVLPQHARPLLVCETPTHAVGVPWIPHTRRPETLFRAYLGAFDDLTTAGREQTSEDLAALDISPLRSASEFHLMVGSAMMQSPVVIAVDGFLDRPRRFGEVRSFLRTYAEDVGIERDASEMWQTLMRWLLLFLPERYTSSTPNYSELFSRRT